jgi:predicted pyridoxine 5'-phosphate oxidase superfamily flavin-nucleotide-binding protein
VGNLTEDMKRVVHEQKLGFAATVCPDGTPNLSPKGTTAVYDDDHLIFADIHSPNTVENLRHNPAIEINVVDPIVRKGYRFKGTATVIAEGERYRELLAFYEREGVADVGRRIRSIVLVKVERALPLVSPAYDCGATEEEIRARWKAYWETVERDRRRGGASK